MAAILRIDSSVDISLVLDGLQILMSGKVDVHWASSILQQHMDMWVFLFY